MDTNGAVKEAIMLLAKINRRLGVLEVRSRDDELFTAYIFRTLEDGIKVRWVAFFAVMNA